MNTPIQIRTVVSMPFEENTYVVWRAGQSDAVVFDPGVEPDLSLDLLREQGLTVTAILNAHGHADHIGGNAALKDAFPEAPLVIGAGDRHMLSDADANLTAPFGMPITTPPADRAVKEADTLAASGLCLLMLAAPCPSPRPSFCGLHGAEPVRALYAHRLCP